MAITIDGTGTITGVSATGLSTAQTVTQSAIATGVAGTGPAFIATASANQAITADTATKINFNTVSVNLNSNYNTSTYRFTPTVAGYYQISGTFQVQTTSTTCVAVPSLYKNGAVYMYGASCPATSNNYPITSVSG